MKLAERILHSVIFEIGAIGVATAAVWFAGAGIAMEAAVGTGLAMSLTAMIWNLVFNYFVDRRFSGKREARGLMFRIGHTLAFEAGLLLFTIPLVAYLLDLSLWHALLADIGLSLLIMQEMLVQMRRRPSENRFCPKTTFFRRPILRGLRRYADK